VGFKIAYQFHTCPDLSLYTTPKNNLVGQWKEETGLSWKISKDKNVTVSASIGYVINYPSRSSATPPWIAAISFRFPLVRANSESNDQRDQG